MLKIFYVVSICVTSPHVGVIANIVWTRAVRAVIRLLITFLREIGRLRLKIKLKKKTNMRSEIKFDRL